MEKKVAIMTWHRYYNYGTCLQVTALAHVIRRLGYEAKVINYTPKALMREISPISSYLKKIPKKFLVMKNKPYVSAERDKKFEEFLTSQIQLTDKLETYSELRSLNDSYDAFVCGSDQIWAPTCFDDKYFLSFVDTPAKMISYAPSIGLSHINNTYIRKHMGELIGRFKHLSVREEQGKELIQRHFGKSADVVLDPSLLLTSADWDAVIKPTEATEAIENHMPSQYMLCYFLGQSERYQRYLSALSTELSMPIYAIPVARNSSSNVIKNLPIEVGPAEFVALIKNASHVITDSFHGLAFSIIYNKPVTVFERFLKNDKINQNSRIHNILRKTALEDKLVDYQDISKICVSVKPPSDASKKMLLIEKEHSMDYLSNALRQATAEPKKNFHSLAKQKSATEVSFYDRDLCCGCGACATVCPTAALTIKKNINGFYHYQIDTKLCVNCGKCRKVCPFIQPPGTDILQSENFYSAKSQNRDTLKRSSSGGISHEIGMHLSDEMNGVVGCSYDKKHNVARHVVIPAGNVSDLFLIQGSKYIPSDFHSIVRQIAEMEGALVFGTPCQVAGIANLLDQKGKRENFLLVDLICHGVPTLNLWDKCLRTYKRRLSHKNPNGGNELDVQFRTKSYGWRELVLSVQAGDNFYFERQRKSCFYAFFEQMNCYMETCYECPYRVHSKADIRLGDYWGERFENDDTGVSMVAAITVKGDKVIAELINANKIEACAQDIKEYYFVQYPYNQQMPMYYDSLMKDLRCDTADLEYLRKKYCRVPEMIRNAYRVYSRAKRRLKTR